MTVWFTADLHFGHRNIIGYTNRPFPDVRTMNAVLIDRWNALVSDADTIWVLGDVALGRIEHSLALVGSLAGRKMLVPGNHDRCWFGHGERARDWIRAYMEAGFAEVHQEVCIDVSGTSALASHLPYWGDSLEVERYVEQRPEERGMWLMHGHVHQRWRQWGRMINVGVDAWRFQPVSEDQLAALIAEGPADRDCL